MYQYLEHRNIVVSSDRSIVWDIRADMPLKEVGHDLTTGQRRILTSKKPQLW